MKRWQKPVALVLVLLALAFAAQTCSGPKFWYSRTEQKVDNLTAMHADDDGKSFFAKILTEIGVIKRDVDALTKRPVASGGGVKHICTKEQVDMYAPNQGWVKSGTAQKCPAAKTTSTDNSGRISELEEELDEEKKKVGLREDQLRTAKQILSDEREKSATTAKERDAERARADAAEARRQELEKENATLRAKLNEPVVVDKQLRQHPTAQIVIETDAPVTYIETFYLGEWNEHVFQTSNRLPRTFIQKVFLGETICLNVKTDASGEQTVLFSKGGNQVGKSEKLTIHIEDRGKVIPLEYRAANQDGRVCAKATIPSEI